MADSRRAGCGPVFPAIISSLVITLAAVLLPGCSSGEANVTAGNRNGILHYGNGAEPQTLDPHVMSGNPEVTIAGTLFEGLVTRNPWTLEIEPGVARHWEYSDDRRVITFSLNPAAGWSNGDPVTAQDFVWSFQRALNPALGNQLAYTLFPILNAQAYFTGQISDPGTIGVKAPDDHTFELTLENPTPYFMEQLAGYTAYPVHRPTLEAHGRATDRFTAWTRPDNLVGNGPFVLSEWKLHRRITVEKSDTYWGADKVRLNAVVFHPVENQISEEKMFRVGQLHHTQEVPLSKIPHYQAMQDSPYRQAPMLGTYYFMFNTLRAPVNDAKVRQAMAKAIDRATLIATVLGNSELPSPALTPALIPGYQPPDILDYDPEAARRLLAEAGYPDGRGWPGLEFIFNTSENHRKIAVAVQQMWKDVLNIQVTLANQEWKVFLDTLNEMDYQMARMGWIGAYLDPNTFLGKFITGGGTNRTGFSNPRYDEIMLQLAPTEKSPEKRLQLLREAETILMEQVPVIPIYTYNSKHLVHASVKGMPPNVLDIRNFRYVSLEAIPDDRHGED